MFAANRDENLDRPWRPPELLNRVPSAFGPRDLGAGGTWLGVNELGLLVTLANHHGTLAETPSLCSRGTIVLETLRQESADAARRFAEWAAPACKAYTLLVADRERAFVVDHGRDGTQTYRLLPGCHVVTNSRFRDPEDPKARHSLALMEQLTGQGTAPSTEELRALLSDHAVVSPEAAPLCTHPAAPHRFGTSSAAVIVVDDSAAVRRFSFAPGQPCTTPFQDLRLPEQFPAASGGGS